MKTSQSQISKHHYRWGLAFTIAWNEKKIEDKMPNYLTKLKLEGLIKWNDVNTEYGNSLYD